MELGKKQKEGEIDNWRASVLKWVYVMVMVSDLRGLLCAEVGVCNGYGVRFKGSVVVEKGAADFSWLRSTEHSCLVVNAPTANTVAAVEHGIALLTAMARNIAQTDASIKAGEPTSDDGGMVVYIPYASFVGTMGECF